MKYKQLTAAKKKIQAAKEKAQVCNLKRWESCFFSQKINKRLGLVEWCELGKMGEIMELGDGKWAKKQTEEKR